MSGAGEKRADSRGELLCTSGIILPGVTLEGAGVETPTGKR